MAIIKSKWRPFSMAREWSQSLGLKSEKYWRIYRKDGLPSAPEQLYKSEWMGWGYWLGTGNKKRGT